jgi:D-inositol-3-phosphate glycosyltransferase
MRVLSFSVDPALADSSSRAFVRQARYFSEHNADIVVLTTGERAHVSLGGIRVFASGGSSRPHAALRVFKKLFELRKEQYDFALAQDVFFTGFFAYLYARVRRIPLVVQMHGNDLDNPLWRDSSFEHRILNVFGKWLARRADGIRVVNTRLVRYCTEVIGIAPSRVASIPIGTDLSVFTPDGPRAAEGRFVLFVGRLIPEKSPLLFCEIMTTLLKKDLDLRAVIAGGGDTNGNLRPDMEEIFLRAGVQDRVLFLGTIDGEKLSAWYRSSICMVHTAAWEGWGMPMIEALACGCPVVTTDTGCAGEAVVDNVHGFVVPIGDTENLVAKTRLLCEDEALRARFSAAAVQDAARWSVDVLSRRLIDFYRRIASS